MDIETRVEDRQWYVLHTKPKQEERANCNLVAWGVETLHPKLKTRRHNEFTGVPTYITQPLFPDTCSLSLMRVNSYPKFCLRAEFTT